MTSIYANGPTRRDGIFDDERVLALARAMSNATDRLFSQLYALARERAGDDDEARRLFADGLPSIREWTQEAVVREARRIRRTHPRADTAFRYALMRYVQELYSTAGEIELETPPFENFAWHFYRIAARKPHIKSGAFLVADERASQRFARNTIRDTFDRLLRSALHVRTHATTDRRPDPPDEPTRTRSVQSHRTKRSERAVRAFDDRVRAAIRHHAADVVEPAAEPEGSDDDAAAVEPVEPEGIDDDAAAAAANDPVEDARRSEKKQDDRSQGAGPNDREEATATDAANRRRWGPPTRSRARELETLGRLRRAAKSAASKPPDGDNGDIVLDEAPGACDPAIG